MVIRTPSFVFTGDKEEARSLVPRAIHELKILKRLRSLGNLEQDSRVIKFSTGANILCQSIFNEDTIHIYVPPSPEEKEEEIEPELINLLFLTDPIKCYDIAGEEMACLNEVTSKRIFNAWLVDQNNVPWVDEDPDKYWRTASDYPINKVCTTRRSTSSHGELDCRWRASKTYDEVTVHVLRYYSLVTNMFFWCVVIENLGEVVRLGLKDYYPSSGFVDIIPLSTVDDFNTTEGYKAFDIWLDDLEGIKVSFVSDLEGKMYIYTISTERLDIYTLNMRDWFLAHIGSGYTPGYEDRHLRLIGAKENIAYYAHCFMGFGVMYEYSEVFSINCLNGNVEIVKEITAGGMIALYNEFTEELNYIDYPVNCEDNILYETAVYLDNCKVYGYASWPPCNGIAFYCAGAPYVTSGGQEMKYGVANYVNQNPWRDFWTFLTYMYQDVRGGFHCTHPLGGSIYKEGVTVNTRVALVTYRRCANYSKNVVSSGASSCTHYNDWPYATGVQDVSITESGLGALFNFVRMNGKECLGEPPEVTYTAGSAAQSGAYEGEYGVSVFPYYKEFAILKYAVDGLGFIWEDVFVKENNSGILSNIECDPGGQEHFYFTKAIEQWGTV